MKSKGEKQAGAPEMPFQVDHKLSVDITTQVADGMRQAILSGFYKPGDILPKILEFKRGLHVSMRVLQPAYRLLKKEGLISPRRRLGTVVVGPRADVLRGRVVIVKGYDICGYHDMALEAVLSQRLNAAGYAVSGVAATPLGKRGDDAGKGRFGTRQLTAALRQKTSLAVIMGAVPPLERAVAAMGTPYFVIGSAKPRTTSGAGCVGCVPFNIDSALSGVLCRLRERSVRSLVQMGIRQMDLIDSGALRAACGSYEELVGLPRHVERLALDAISRAAYDIFRERYRTKADLPDAFLLTDDYLTRGALTALLSAGFRTACDVLVITLANKGNVPVHADPIDLILYDPVREADAIADALIAYLDTGAAPGTIALESTFVAGEG